VLGDVRGRGGQEQAVERRELEVELGAAHGGLRRIAQDRQRAEGRVGEARQQLLVGVVVVEDGEVGVQQAGEQGQLAADLQRQQLLLFHRSELLLIRGVGDRESAGLEATCMRDIEQHRVAGRPVQAHAAGDISLVQLAVILVVVALIIQLQAILVVDRRVRIAARRGLDVEQGFDGGRSRAPAVVGFAIAGIRLTVLVTEAAAQGQAQRVADACIAVEEQTQGARLGLAADIKSGGDGSLAGDGIREQGADAIGQHMVQLFSGVEAGVEADHPVVVHTPKTA
jgi:hypothetical protein